MVLSVLLVALVGVMAWQVLRTREPLIPNAVYQGKSLRWV
jgi:hypothetical protein